MLWKIKNFLFNLCKKKTILFVFFFAFLGLVYPKVSSAFIVELAKKIAIAPFYYIIYVIVAIAVYITGWAGSLLNWVLSPGFISYSYTNPGGTAPNPVIKTGLAVTQGFANMFLVLILVYIAIATILRLAGYETKKLLVWFIIIALLVNFAPVICGLIVDASNIIMNFFIQDLSVNIFSETMGTKVANEKLEYWQDTEEGPIPKLVQLAVLVPFLFVLTFILLLFAVLFILRYVVIWLLVILSPIAFICYILPITKKYFDLWWKQFLSWSFVGVTCGFFLYLALFLVMQLETSPGVAISTPDIPDSDAPFNAIMPYFVAIAFLGIGFVFGLQTSAMGASTVVNFAKAKGRGAARGVGKGAKWVGGSVRKGINLGDRKIVPRIPPKDEEGKRNWKNLGSYFGTSRQAAKGITKAWEGIPVARWFRPESLRKFSESRSAIEERKKEITGPSDIEIERVDRGVYKGAKAAAAVDSIVRERGDSNDIIKYYMKKYNAKSDKELLENEDFLKDKNLVKAIEFISEAGNRGKIDRIDPRLAKIGRSKEEGQKKTIEAIINAKPGDVINWEKEVPENEEVMETALAIGDDDFFRAMGRLKGKVQARQHTIDKMFSKFVDDNELDATKNKENWEAFMQSLCKKYNVLTTGIEKALTNVRFQSAGWGYIKEFNSGARYLTKEQTEEPSGVSAMRGGLQEGKGKPSKIILPAETEIREAKEQKEREFKEKQITKPKSSNSQIPKPKKP